jgi:hypothetical protein
MGSVHGVRALFLASGIDTREKNEQKKETTQSRRER